MPRAHYEANKQAYLDRAKAQVAKRKAWLEALKSAPCVDCGGSFPSCCMEFHHVDPSQKVMAIGKAVSRMGQDRLEAEIAKCVLLCANCHRIREHA